MKVSGSTRRLVERFAHDRELVARIIRRHFGFTRRDIHPPRAKGSGVAR